MINGIVVSNEEGTPQGGPLSPLLSNIMLDELDKEKVLKIAKKKSEELKDKTNELMNIDYMKYLNNL